MPKTTSGPALGSISADESCPLDIFKARNGLSDWAMRMARRQGLKVALLAAENSFWARTGTRSWPSRKANPSKRHEPAHAVKRAGPGEGFNMLSLPPDGPATQSRAIDWPTLCRIEPRLEFLEATALRCRPSRADFWDVYERFKCELAYLVGWRAGNPILAAGFDIAHRRILAALESRRPRRRGRRRG